MFLHLIEEDVKKKTSKINFHAPLAHSLTSNTVLSQNEITIATSTKTIKRENCLFENIDGTHLKYNESFFKKVSIKNDQFNTPVSLKREQYGTAELKFSLDRPVNIKRIF